VRALERFERPLPKRSLILAGGGLKVAFQAGVLQVWLDEAGLTFDHADGASGGCFNLAMYCQGMSGTKIADNWRTLEPFLPVDVNIDEAWRVGQAASLLTHDNLRKRVFPFWGLDWAAINASQRAGTFTLFNFSKKRLEVVTQDRIDEDRLVSAVSLPMWFEPVVIQGDTYIDAVFISDANVEEAIRRGADEIWAIWTVSTKDEWRPGFVNQYYQIIETTADTNFFGIWRRIQESNDRITAGQAGEFGRRIELKLLQAEVPLHYLINISKDRMAEAVNLGVQTARAWCTKNGVPMPNQGPDIPPTPGTPFARLEFTEEMSGFVGAGSTQYAEGEAAGRAKNQPLKVRLTIQVANVDHFIVSPQHEGSLSGWVESPIVGGRAAVESGQFNLLVDNQNVDRKEMKYRVICKRQNGPRYTLSGFKKVESDTDVWTATTTLFTSVYEGEVAAGGENNAVVIGRGLIRIGFVQFLQQLTTFRVEGPTPAARLQALSQFGVLFMGKLWDVYGATLARPPIA
jgi:predicted acylesterase/phospholipase RssA